MDAGHQGCEKIAAASFGGRPSAKSLEKKSLFLLSTHRLAGGRSATSDGLAAGVAAKKLTLLTYSEGRMKPPLITVGPRGSRYGKDMAARPRTRCAPFANRPARHRRPGLPFYFRRWSVLEGPSSPTLGGHGRGGGGGALPVLLRRARCALWWPTPPSLAIPHRCRLPAFCHLEQAHIAR